MRLRTPALSLLLLTSVIALAHAGEEGEVRRRQINVPVQPLAETLRQFAEQTGLQLAFETALTAGRMSAEVKGEMSNEEALERLLQGTGLRYDFIDENTVAVSSATRKPRGLQRIAQSDAGSPSFETTPDEASTPADEVSMLKLEEVVVTATKRNTRLVDTPAQINVIGADYLNKNKIQQFADLSGSVPNFLVPDGLLGTSNITIRGLSSPARGGTIAEQPVSAYFDGVFAPEGSLDGLMYDIGQVEIIRGPQGVVWGRNTLAGAISFTSKRPTRELEGYVEAGAGSHNLVETRGAISGPIARDKVLFRLAGAHQERDGYSKRISGGTFGAVDRQAVRGSLQFLLSDELDVLLINDYSRNRYTSPVPEFFSGPFSAAAVTDGYSRRQDTDFYEPSRAESFGSTAIAAYDFGGAQLSSITAYRSTDQELASDTDGSPQHLVHDSLATGAGQFSQELRLASDVQGASRLDWMLGLYYYQRTNTLHQAQSYGQTLAPLLGAPNGATIDLLADQRSKIRSAAAFGTAEFHVTDAFSVHAGLRVTEDVKRSSMVQAFEAVIPGIGAVPLFSSPSDLSLDETQVSPLLGLSYKPTSDTLLYASWGRGHKSGGFNSSRVSRPTFGPEEADSFEAGYKTAWLDDRFSLNLAAFYINYRDLQARNLEGVEALFLNAGKARSEGVELELMAQPLPQWRLSGSFGYNDAKFEHFILDGAGGPDRDLQGNGLPFAPRTSVSVRSEYSVPLGALGELYLHAEWNRVGDYYLDIVNTPTGRQPSYDLANARIGIALDSGIEVGVWGRNLTDEDYRVDFFGDLPAFIFGGSAMHLLGPPRSYGADIKLKF